MKKIQSIVTALLPLFLLLIILFILFGKIFFPPPGKMLYGGDIYDAYFFWKNYLRVSILSGIIPFWNPYNFSGMPFLSHPNINIFYPLSWIFIFFPLNVSFAIYFFIHLIIAFATMYWLVRQLSDKWGATFAGLTYALSGYFAARIYSGHLEYVDTAAWIPLVFGLVRLAFIKPSARRILAGGTGLAIIIFSGNELFLLFTLEVVGLYIIYFLLIKEKGKRLIVNFGRLFKVLFLYLIIGFGLAAVEFLPRWQFIQSSIRSLGITYGVSVSGSGTFTTLRLLVQPFYYGGLDNYHGPWPNISEYTYYVGAIPILSLTIFIGYFLLRNIFKKFKSLKIINNINGEVWFFILIIPIFAVISLGNNINPSLFQILWKYTPFYKSIRFPVRHLFVAVFALSAASGMILGGIKDKVLKIIILGIIIVDLVSFDKNFLRLIDAPTATFDKELINTLQNDHSLYRLLPDYSVISGVRRDLDFGAATMYKIPTTSDYNSMILARYYHFIDLLNKSPYPSIEQYNVEIPPPNPRSSYIDFLNVKYILTDNTIDYIGKEEAGKFKLKTQGDRYRLYENETYLPRFFFGRRRKNFYFR